MITIICGEINQGKTSKIKSVYLEEKEGDGFLTEKIFIDSVFCGYEIRRLTTGESHIQSLKSGLFPANESPVYTRGAFSFFKDGFSYADYIIDEIIVKGINPVFIDEIGPLELQGKGHCSSFRKILNTDRTIYFSARNFYVEKIISYFSLENYSLIKL